MRVIQNTTFIPFSEPINVIKPQSPVWVLKNTGAYTAYINGSIALKVGDFFGIDMLPLLIPALEAKLNGGEQINYVNDTEFTITFPGVPNNVTLRQVTLMETTFKMEK